jgi:hypothetical protein
MSSAASALALQPARALTLELDPGRFRFSLWRNVSITIWTAQATLEAGQRVLRVSRQLNRDFPEGRSQVLIVSAGTPAPDAETSELMTEIYSPHLSRVVCIATVLEGSGFWASGIRSRMTSMLIAAGSALAMRTHDSVEDVATWLPAEHAQRTGVSLNPGELRSMLLAVRELGTRDEA